MNKYIIVALLSLFGTVAAQAQTQKGNQLLGGFISLSSSKGTTTYQGLNPYNNNNFVSTDKMSSLGVGPTYSYFLADNLDLGFTAGYYTQKQSSTIQSVEDNIDKQKGFNAAVYLRKYFLYESKIGFRVGPYAKYQYGKSTTDYQNNLSSDGLTENKYFDAGLGFDFVYFPTRKLGMAATLGTLAYSHQVFTQTYTGQYSQEQKDHSFGLNLITSGLALSVTYAFGK